MLWIIIQYLSYVKLWSDLSESVSLTALDEYDLLPLTGHWTSWSGELQRFMLLLNAQDGAIITEQKVNPQNLSARRGIHTVLL